MLLYLRTTDQSTEDICYTGKINTCVTVYWRLLLHR
jgi:hypothetical protein